MTFTLMELNEVIAQRIKTLRSEKKISQEKLASLADIDRTFLQSIEKGKRNISVKTLFKISTALNLKISKVLENIENEL